ncbi:uncharacterized protein [Watersipora subatra]|uniref:uncharacterized protein n=1 Tax=Watersipora subatra TaxID=2589382 RepID=UPI00355BAE42
MGGVDLLDSFLASFRFKMRSRRWYLYLFWHFMMVALINSWNVYRKDFQLLKLPKKEMLSRRRFQSYLASTLIKVNSQPKRGRLLSASSSPASPAQSQKKRRHALPDDVQTFEALPRPIGGLHPNPQVFITSRLTFATPTCNQGIKA